MLRRVFGTLISVEYVAATKGVTLLKIVMCHVIHSTIFNETFLKIAVKSYSV